MANYTREFLTTRRLGFSLSFLYRWAGLSKWIFIESLCIRNRRRIYEKSREYCYRQSL